VFAHDSARLPFVEGRAYCTMNFAVAVTIMAPEDTIAKYKDRYAGGWDQVRAERHAKQPASGIVREEWGITARDPRVPKWQLASFHENEMRRTAGVPAHDVGKCLRVPVTKYSARAAWAHSRNISSFGSAQALTRSVGRTEK
jgi:hypothetical protein